MTEINRSKSEVLALDRAREAALAALVARDPERAKVVAERALTAGRRLWRVAPKSEGGLRYLDAAAGLASIHGMIERALHPPA